MPFKIPNKDHPDVTLERDIFKNYLQTRLKELKDELEEEHQKYVDFINSLVDKLNKSSSEFIQFTEYYDDLHFETCENKIFQMTKQDFINEMADLGYKVKLEVKKVEQGYYYYKVYFSCKSA
uniref:Uncharacterized protein n=1 Tax=viral metagenome TaxID=1070528 RepID=A0A6C0CL72_9ZZZZ